MEIFEFKPIPWKYLLFEYLKEAGDKGLNLNEIHCLFPSKTKQCIMSTLYRNKIPRKSYKDKVTGKCKKVYIYPKKIDNNWQGQVQRLLQNSEYGMTLTELLLETGVPKADLEAYLKNAENFSCPIKEIKLTKVGVGIKHPIVRFVLGNKRNKIKKDEVLLSNYVKKYYKKKEKNQEKLKQEIIKNMNYLIDKNKRFTVKEVSDIFMNNKDVIPTYLIYRMAKEEFKFTEMYCKNDVKNRKYKVFHRDKNVILKDNEVIADIFPLLMEKVIIESINELKNESLRINIKKRVEEKLRIHVSEGYFSLFQKTLHSLRERNIIKLTKINCTRGIYKIDNFEIK